MTMLVPKPAPRPRLGNHSSLTSLLSTITPPVNHTPSFTSAMVNFVAREDNPPTYDVAVGSSTGKLR